MPPVRALMNAQVTAMRTYGVDVDVWITHKAFVAGMAEAIALTGPAVVLLPATADRPGIVRRTLEYWRAGSMSRWSPLGRAWS